MDPLMDLVHTASQFSGIPGLAPAVALLKSTAAGVENVKVYKQQCSEMRRRGLNLMVALKDGSEGLEGTKVIEIADEIEVIMRRVDRKLTEWGVMSQLRSYLAQREIKDGIDSLNRDIDEASMRFNLRINMELARGQMQSQAIQERDRAELRDLLQQIVSSQESMKVLVGMQQSRESHPVDEIMEGLQTELMNPSLESVEEEVFKAGLWELHEKTAKLPPLTNLTGQVDLDPRPVARGTYNDIFRGLWLDKEQVALRLPRTIANSPDDQRDFQGEVSVWRGLSHPNVVPLYGVVYQSDYLYSVSPWMDNESVTVYLKKYPTVDRLKLLTDAAMGLQYLHGKHVVHGDIKGANLLISRDGTARLSDFGFSTFLEDSGRDMGRANNINPRWSAPELLKQTGRVSTNSDIWSFGMLCLEVLSGQPPYAKTTRDMGVFDEIYHERLPDRPGTTAKQNGLSDQVWNFLRSTWKIKPEERPSIEKVVNTLFSIRGLRESIPEEIPLTERKPSVVKKSSIFSRRPKTSDGAKEGSNGKTISRIDEDEPSTTNMAPRKVNIAHSDSTSYRNTRHNSISSVTTTPSIVLDPFSPSHSPLMSGRSASMHTPSKQGSLSVPQSSSAPTSFGTHFPDRRGSAESHHGRAMTIGSAISSSSSHLSGPAREAVTDPREIVQVNPAGMVVFGTLEGFVKRLIMHFNSRKEAEFRDVLLAACTDFTTPEDLFAILARRFYDAETDERQHHEDRVAVQYNIFLVIMFWLNNRNLPVDNQLLWQMQSFSEDARRMKTSETMREKAGELLGLIQSRRPAFSPPLSPTRPRLGAAQMSPSLLAIALTLLEGDKYKALVPGDYIAHLRRHSGHHNLEALYTTNNRIIFWVKDSILHYENAEQRADVMKFFIHTANECLKLRNFASLTAIASALHSAPIDRLKLTKAGLKPELKNKLKHFESIIDPSSNHRGYRDALNDAGTSQQRDQCIPWLAVHLKELHLVLHRYPATVEYQGRPMINFERYVRFMDRVREVAHYKPPNLAQYRSLGYLDYLETQLRNLGTKLDGDEQLATRSRLVEARETMEHRTRIDQLRRLGFNTRT